MTTHSSIPTAEQAQRIRDRVIAEAAHAGRRPSVLAAARELGLSNTTFRRRFPDIAQEIGEARSTPATRGTTSTESGEQARLVARNAKLRRENQRLRTHLNLAVANIARLTLQGHELHRRLEATSQVTRLESLDPRRR